jgi:hypothetical protein
MKDAEHKQVATTTRKCLPGEWRINAETDPDNRLLTVTDLEFNLTQTAASLLKGETVSLDAIVTKSGNKIAVQNFSSYFV